MAFLFESRKINDRNIIINFSFETSRTITDVGYCSLDKFMSYNDWLIIFENLTTFLKQFLSNESNPPEKSSISIPSIQLELIITWQKTRSIHADILSLNFNECFSHYMSVEVKSISKVNKFLHQQKAELENSIELIKKNDDSTNVECGNGIINGKYEEYVPTAISNISPNVKYMPMTSSKKSDKYKYEEYVPKSVSPLNSDAKVNGIHKSGEKDYKPSQSVNHNNNHTRKQETPMPKPGIISRTRRERKPRIDLFGETYDLEVHKKPIEKTPTSRDKLMRSKESSSSVALKKKKLQYKSSPSTLMNLKEISQEEILSSFDYFREDFHNFFQDYQQKGKKVKRSKEYDHMLLPTTLLTTNQVYQMMDRLNSEFRPNADYTVISNDNALFWELLLPEWALRLYMRKNSFARTEAIDEIKKQEFVPDITFSINKNS